VQRYVLEGTPARETGAVREVPLPMRAAMAGLAVACLLLGILAPLHKDRLITPAGRALTDERAYAATFQPPTIDVTIPQIAARPDGQERQP